MEEFEIYTQEVFERDSIKIYFILRRNGKTSLGNINERGRVVFSEINPEESVEEKPTMIIDYYYFKIFGKAILKVLDKHGIKPEEESFTKGKLLATEYHLEDLRKIIKLEK